MQDYVFETAMTDDQLRIAAQYAVDILEEYKRINNSGMNREKLNMLVEEVREKYAKKKDDFWKIMEPLEIMDSIATDKLCELKLNIARLCRVGGAYWMLISHPCLASVLFSVFESIVDNFDNEEHYRVAAYFLLRGIMKVRSN